MMNGKKHKDLPFQIAMIILFSIIFIVCLYPFYYIFIASISSPEALRKTTLSWYPLGLTLENYKTILGLSGIPLAFLVSIARTVLGTAITLFFTSILAFTLTKQILPGRKFFYRIAIISMYIQAGLIPWYLTMRNLGLKDSLLVYILPTAVSAYSMILIKTYMESIGDEIQESALIDGANYFQIFIKIMIPICKPVLAAIIVFTAVGQWNSWTDNLLLVNNLNLRTLQLILLDYLNQATNIANDAKNGAAMSSSALSPFAIRMTITMVVTIPILLVYPFMQKYFISGIMVGAVKG